VRSFHVPTESAKTLKPIIAKNVEKASVLMADEAAIYRGFGKKFEAHHIVCRSANDYARLGSHIHINTAQSYFSLVKRGIIGSFHHVSEAPLSAPTSPPPPKYVTPTAELRVNEPVGARERHMRYVLAAILVGALGAPLDSALPAASPVSPVASKAGPLLQVAKRTCAHAARRSRSSGGAAGGIHPLVGSGEY